MLDRIGYFKSEKGVARFIAKIAISLNELHSRNILHRDLKPTNLLIAEDSSGVLKLGDFIYAKRIQKG